MNGDNDGAIEAWNTVLFDKFVRFRRIVTDGFAEHGARPLRERPYAAGARVLDVGCGFGDTTLAIAEQVGPAGQAIGVDCGAGFIRLAKAEAEALAQTSVSYFVADVQRDNLLGPYDQAFARFGTMFFAPPVAALRRVRNALRAGGELTMVVWRRREDNPWVYEAERAVREILPVTDPEASGQVHCGPGPFSMAGADLVSDLMKAADFADISLTRTDCDICVGQSIDDAVDFAMALGPAGEIVRLSGLEGERLRPQVVSALRQVFEQYRRADGSIWAGSSSWTVRGRRSA
ncbi:MAG TPA: class I SAM-dependent methyltransferase [Polyangiaceae bacterium]|jgi:ubiquinone/menaquinone biosynthesis C-methylase UbiE|nr:class I SAM-dependent methyltransferase [Polyangiaceae bacterium]